MHRTPEGRPMGSLRIVVLVCWTAILGWAGVPVYGQSAPGPAPPASSKQSGDKGAPAGVPGLPRGKKLVLKDGTFQLVRGYSRNGERVRYLSAERGDWEEIPAAMVDWDATAKVAAAGRSDEDALTTKINPTEQDPRIE